MNTQRLQTLANFLRTVPAEHFDLGFWRNNRNLVDATMFKREAVSNEDLTAMHCGTTGCAVGWACAMPEFQAQGLRWTGTMPSYSPPDGSCPTDHWSAVTTFFDLSFDQSQELFESWHYKDADLKGVPNEVADRIEAMIALNLT